METTPNILISLKILELKKIVQSGKKCYCKLFIKTLRVHVYEKAYENCTYDSFRRRILENYINKT